MATYQHYVPRFYLKGFLDPLSVGVKKLKPYLWVVDLKNKKIKNRSPKNIAGRAGYYDLLSLNPEYRSVLERIYSRTENHARQVIHQLQNQQFQLSLQDRADLSNFIGLQLTRVPIYRQYMNIRFNEVLAERFQEVLADENRLHQRLGEHAKWFKEYVQTRKPKPYLKFESEDHKRDFATLSSFFAGYDYYAGLAFSRIWMFVLAEEVSTFFTSDNPVSLLSPDSKSIKIDFNGRNEFLEIVFPISSSCALLMHAHYKHPNIHSAEVVTVNEKAVIELNRRRLPTVGRLIFCSSEKQAKLVLSQSQIAI